MRAAVIAFAFIFPLVGGAHAQGFQRQELEQYLHEQLFSAIQDRINEIIRDTHPSVLGATGTGELLARNLPVIQQHLRDTRAAIYDEYEAFTSPSIEPPDSPFAFIEDPSDREVLERYLDQLEHLHAELARAIEFGDMASADGLVAAIGKKGAQIENIMTRWEPVDLSPDPANMICQPQMWAGSWCTTYRTMNLSVSGIGATGRYEWDNGSLHGILSEDGCTLSGEWYETPHDSDTDWGWFEFGMSTSGDGWSGTWGYNTSASSSGWSGSPGAC